MGNTAGWRLPWVRSHRGRDAPAVRATTSAIVLLVLSLVLLLIEWPVARRTPVGKLLISRRVLLLLAFGEHLSRSGRLFTSSTETGLLEAYDPPIHPSTLHAVFEEILLTVMDPLLRAKYEQFMAELIGHRKAKIEALSAKEKLLALQWMRCDGQILTPALAKEIEEVLKTMASSSSSSTRCSRPMCGPTVRQGHRGGSGLFPVDATHHRTHPDGEPPRSPRPSGGRRHGQHCRRKHGAVHVHPKPGRYPSTVVLRMQSPDFRPSDLALTFHLPAGEAESLLGSAVPVSGEGDEDVIGSWSGCSSWAPLRGNPCFQTAMARQP